MQEIDIYIHSKKDLTETYDEKVVSSSLIQYILQRAIYIKRKESIRLILHVSNDTKGCTKQIQKGLEEEYRTNLQQHYIINIKQFLLLIIGLGMLFISTLIQNNEILEEIILIGGWVPIWEAIELELLTDTKDRRIRKLLKKLLKSEMIEMEDITSNNLS